MYSIKKPSTLNSSRAANNEKKIKPGLSTSALSAVQTKFVSRGDVPEKIIEDKRDMETVTDDGAVSENKLSKKDNKDIEPTPAVR